MNENIQVPFIIRNHSDDSNGRLLDCIIKQDDLVSYAEELGYECVALTDHESLSGHVYAEKVQAKHPNIKYIRGNEIYLVRNGLAPDNYTSKDRYFHFILLARDYKGHEQLQKISTKAWMRAVTHLGMMRVPTYYSDLEEVIGEEKGHLIASTACRGGFIPTLILRAKEADEKEKAQLTKQIIDLCYYFVNLFGEGNFYLELQPSHDSEQVYINKQLLKLSKATGIPYIITEDAHYLKKEDRYVHEAYLNSKEGDREVAEFYATTYLMSTEELESYFDYYMSDEEFEVAYQNIRNIANKCEDYTLEKPLRIPSLEWVQPKLQDLPPFIYEKIPLAKTFMESDFNGDRVMMLLIAEKILSDKRLQNDKIYNEVNECLNMVWISSNVNKAHWSAYLLNLQKNIEYLWEAGTLVGPSRGSGGGFILLYLLDIIQINAMWEKAPTMRERFLNPSRVSPLD